MGNRPEKQGEKREATGHETGALVLKKRKRRKGKGGWKLGTCDKASINRGIAAEQC